MVVHDERAPRGSWKLARVLSLITGCDRRVRGAVVKQAARDRQATVLQCPLQFLYPLEVCDTASGGESNAAPTAEPNVDSTAEKNPSPVEGHPQAVRRSS